MRRPAVYATLLAVFVLLAGVWGFRRVQAAREPRRIQVVIAPSSDPGGLDAHQREGLRLLVADHLEVLGGVSLLEGLPPGASLPKGALRLKVRATFWDGHLRLEPHWEGRNAPGTAAALNGTPDWVISELLAPLGVPAARPGLLRPEDPAACMELVTLLGRPVSDDAGESAKRLAGLARRYPDCATVQYAFAGVLYITSILRPGERDDGQARCEAAFVQAMALLPHMPRGVRTYAFFAADTGRGREALAAGLDCAAAYPKSPNAAISVAYPARISGLLDLSERAMRRQARLTGLPRTMHTATDNTRLYRGDLSGFAASLELPQSGPQPALLDFYRGYVRLLGGDRTRALPFFLRGAEGDAAVQGFGPLNRCYALALQGRPDEAKVALDGLARSRQMVQILDGELTFKVAEAYGFLGEDREALEFANLAATQGFLCLRWYEAAPFLAGARKLPYWATLRRHLQERQALLEAQFPLSRMGT